MNDLSLYSYCKLPLIIISPRPPVIDPSHPTPGISPPLAVLVLNSTYYGFMKLNHKPVNAKRLLISTAVACLEAPFLCGL